MAFKHIGLFEGIGGFSLAARAAGWETVAWSEIDPFCRAVLSYHFSDAEALSDIRTTNFTKYAGKIDVLTGGFPCQPYSLSGKRLGKDDDRHLWPEMLRAIREIAPRWVVGENVYGLLSWNGGMVFNEVQTDLENEGYQVQTYLLPACSVDAPHQRYRIWFVAYRADSRAEGVQRRRENAIHGFGASTYTMCSQGEWTIRRVESVSFDGGKQTIAHSEIANSNGYASGATEENPINGEHGHDGIIADTMRTGRAKHDFTREPERQRYCTWIRYEFITNAIGSGWVQSNEKPSSKLKPNQALPDWRGFPTQQPICGRNDGFPTGLVRISIYSRKGRRFISERQAKARLRREAIKAYGNAVVPQVVYQIFKTINEYEREHTTQPN